MAVPKLDAMLKDFAELLKDIVIPDTHYVIKVENPTLSGMCVSFDEYMSEK